MGLAEAGAFAPLADRGRANLQERRQKKLGRAEDSVSTILVAGGSISHCSHSVCKSLLATPPFSRLSLSVRFFVPDVERVFNEAPCLIEDAHQELSGVLGDTDLQRVDKYTERGDVGSVDVQDANFREQCISKAFQLHEPRCAVCGDGIDKLVSACFQAGLMHSNTCNSRYALTTSVYRPRICCASLRVSLSQAACCP